MYIFPSLIYLWCLAGFSDGARILASISIPSYSHQVAYRTIWKELARRGHEIVLLTTDPMEGHFDNIRQINLSSTYEIHESYKVNTMISNDMNKNLLKLMKLAILSISEAHRHELLQPEVQALIHNSTEHFDLLMVEVVFPIHIGFIERFKVPVIGLTSLDAPSSLHRLMGNEDNPIIHPQHVFNLPPSPTIIDKAVSIDTYYMSRATLGNAFVMELNTNYIKESPFLNIQ